MTLENGVGHKCSLLELHEYPSAVLPMRNSPTEASCDVRLPDKHMSPHARPAQKYTRKAEEKQWVHPCHMHNGANLDRTNHTIGNTMH